MKKEGEIKQTVENLRHKMDITELLNAEHPGFKIPRTFGQRASDALTKWAGSWTFIISIGILLAIWIIVNTVWIFFRDVWDPYPFILLNFILSTLAAIQAPIILMSQNRQAQKDRLRTQVDYEINRKAEEEIRDIKKQLDKIEKMFERRRK